MSQRKQTARKTTGKHTTLISILSGAATPKSKPKPRRQTAASGKGGSRSKSSPAKPSVPTPGPSNPVPPVGSRAARGTSLDDVHSSGPGPGGSPRSVGEAKSTSSTLIGRRSPARVLDEPIAVCTRFAAWVENQRCVNGEVLLRAVERDGSHFLSLARVTVTFDHVLRGRVLPPPPAPEDRIGSANPLREHARTLCAFADVLENKASEGTLGEDLEAAVLRDGEALLRLARCCLALDQAVRGSDAVAS